MLVTLTRNFRHTIPTFAFSRRGISDVATVRLYRILLRQLQVLPSNSFLLQTPLNPQDYGRARLIHSLSPKAAGSQLANGYEIHALCKLFARWLLADENSREEEASILMWYKDTIGQELHNDRDHDDFDMCSWSSREILLSSLRTCFRAKKSTVHKKEKLGFAIKASLYLQNVARMQEKSTTSIKDGIRVVATSSCIGTASSGIANIQDMKHRFAYRIRVENLPDNDKTVQLLGRSWLIREDAVAGMTPTDPVFVDAPTGGAVGHLPVLEPGYVFEYMSGCELANKTGKMEGKFYMATVPAGTSSAIVGDELSSLKQKDKFEVPVEPFPLIAD